ncbi:ATP-binding protein [Phenylobacterium deserti]|uniref:OmpR/PhoB-type domain-containing protein n=1 Tax=Phenylobacterium deserti TaxID=1914756 RepID=A0A328ADP9_9CAUL|nr:winged helix-turn-helix domain-containing protein [Phenylobacterium deserti]RAK52705.1 hypothetical protein DJ018_10960 [Phenylobacterium deserti]
MLETSDTRPAAALHFAGFALFPAQRRVLRDDVAVPLGSRAFDILWALAEARGAVVPKAELMARAWPGLHVEEANLRVQIAGLRKALGPEDLVASVPGVGYSLATAVLDAASATPVRRDPDAVAAPELIGRGELLADLQQRFEHQRLVTLVGPGGVGKTSVARRHAGAAARTAFVDLSALADARLAASTLAVALGLPVMSSDPTPAIVRHLAGGDWLLVLDNCEHVVETVAGLAEQLLQACPTLAILATSREPLRCEGEWVLRLDALAAPPAGDLTAREALQYPAIQLLVTRAEAAWAGFTLTDADAPVAAELCRRLDGLPLALELAAARIEAFGLEGLAGQLHDHLELLSGGRRTALPRRQTIAAALDWSYALLSPAERQVLEALAVFRGPFSLAAAVEVSAGDDLSPAAVRAAVGELSAKSLLARERTGPRLTFRLLETTRIYAARKLQASPRAPEIAARHARHVQGLIAQANEDWNPAAHQAWAEVHGRIIDEVRAALAWRFSAGQDVQAAADLVAASASLWFQLVLLDEYIGWLERGLALPGASADSRMRMHAALAHAVVQARGLHPLVPQSFEACLALAEAQEDVRHQWIAVWGLAGEASMRADYRAALGFAERLTPVVQRTGSRDAQLVQRRLLALQTHMLGRHDRALDLVAEVLAEPCLEVASAFHSQVHLDQVCAMQVIEARALWLTGAADRARAVVDAALARAAAIENAFTEAYVLSAAACPVAFWRGDPDVETLIERLTRLSVGRSLVVYESWGHAFAAARRFRLGGPPPRVTAIKALDELAVIDARLLSDETVSRCQAGTVGWCAPEALRGQGLALAAAGDLASACARFEAAERLADQQGAAALALRAATSLLEHRPGDAAVRARLAERVGNLNEGRTTRDVRAAVALLA